jgi:UDP-glucose 4-epimerase
MKALIIGGTGFIGSHLLDRLVAGGDSVRVLAPDPERFRAPMENIDYRIGTLMDPAVTRTALEGVDIVYHLANSKVPSTSNQDPIADIQENLVATVGLLESMYQVGVGRIVFLSSGGTVYGECGSDPISEDHVLQPSSSYGIVKVAIENYLCMFRRLYGLSYCVLRASNPYGPRQGAIGVQGVIATMLYNTFRNEAVPIWGDGRVVRDYVYIEDLAEGISTAGRAGLEGIFNLGSGEGHSLVNLLDVIRDVTGKVPKVEFQPSRKVDIQRIVLGISRIRMQLGWEPKVPLARGIERHWLWMQSAIKGGML